MKMVKRIIIQTEKNKEIKQCNYANDYYGDQVCIIAKPNK